ncbi:MAG: hypothetical protein M0D53_13080 [Flavobacterium sp. JAD_PAG50586_2]|nr:MAG: hypothetical protein M0D53_13080 [Flavobacterium sp. JAD_PAG50586_2]
MKNRIREFIYNRYNISFSKSGDDVQLMKLINNRTPGAYVDIGCWHPVKASNTYFFYVRGWKGICIDPNPELKVLYDQLRPKDNFVNAGVGESGSSLEYYMFEESSMNTFSYDFVKKHNAESKIIKKLEIPLYSLKEILDANLDKNDRLDFLILMWKVLISRCLKRMTGMFTDLKLSLSNRILHCRMILLLKL